VMGRYWIKSLHEWAPEGPAYSCPDIDIAIEAMESVREINEELRADLKVALETIEYLDSMVCELEAKLEAQEVMSDG